jgi:hypothetical protein
MPFTMMAGSIRFRGTPSRGLAFHTNEYYVKQFLLLTFENNSGTNQYKFTIRTYIQPAIHL